MRPQRPEVAEAGKSAGAQVAQEPVATVADSRKGWPKTGAAPAPRRPTGGPTLPLRQEVNWFSETAVMEAFVERLDRLEAALNLIPEKKFGEIVSKLEGTLFAYPSAGGGYREKLTKLVLPGLSPATEQAVKGELGEMLGLLSRADERSTPETSHALRKLFAPFRTGSRRLSPQERERWDRCFKAVPGLWSVGGPQGDGTSQEAERRVVAKRALQDLASAGGQVPNGGTLETLQILRSLRVSQRAIDAAIEGGLSARAEDALKTLRLGITPDETINAALKAAGTSPAIIASAVREGQKQRTDQALEEIRWGGDPEDADRRKALRQTDPQLVRAAIAEGIKQAANAALAHIRSGSPCDEDHQKAFRKAKTSRKAIDNAIAEGAAKRADRALKDIANGHDPAFRWIQSALDDANVSPSLIQQAIVRGIQLRASQALAAIRTGTDPDESFIRSALRSAGTPSEEIQAAVEQGIARRAEAALSAILTGESEETPWIRAALTAGKVARQRIAEVAKAGRKLRDSP